MGMEAASSSASLSSFGQLRLAPEILRTEGHALLGLADRLGTEFCRAVDRLFACRGRVLVSGMGKAGLVGQKIAATLASTGTRSHFLHPAEALHGDLGRVHHDDVMLVLSFSGEAEEIGQ
jgi:arabinose-5-phosphate isomerase